MDSVRRNRILVNIQELKEQYCKKLQLLEDTLRLLSSFNKQPSQPKKIYKKPSIKKNPIKKKSIERKKIYTVSSTYNYSTISLEDSIKQFIKKIQNIPKKQILEWYPDIDTDIQNIIKKLK